MKKKFSFALALVLAFVMIFQVMVAASDISLLNNNTAVTQTCFTISSTGKATVNVFFEGYPDTTTGATITVKIEKRNFLLFWIDKVEETYTISGESYVDAYYYQLEDTGTYRCTVTYVVSGTGGADDTITFQDTAEY